ncbi:MAG: HEAT repeat domain-containing protein [Gemmataceae bacterium]
MRPLLILPAVALALLLLPGLYGNETDTTSEDEQRLKAAFQPVDGPGLVNFLRTRAQGEVSQERLAELIDSLDHRNPTTRLKAAGDLIAIGSPAIPMLRRAARDLDHPETASLARQCLKILEEEPGLVTIAAIRLLAVRKPTGTAETLLAYLPHAETEGVMEELKNALASAAYTQGKADPALLKALTDPHPLRRASAIVALCSSGIAEPRDILRKLLMDPMPSVRLRASMALAQAHDAKAVSTLITLLTDLPINQAKEVESFLGELAAEQAPKINLGADDPSRQKARDAWARWWLDSEEPTLLDELKKRTLTEIDTNQAASLIEKLGDDSFEVRQKAEDELRKLGSRIIPLLKQAQKNLDLEIRNRASKCLAAIEMEKIAPLSPVTARLIALRKPRGAVETLLAYMPFADEDSIADELQTALNAAAFPGGKAHPAIVKALEDRSPARRAAAAQALTHGPHAEYLPAIRAMLNDKDLTVRTKVALALAASRDREAVPALIALVGVLSSENSAQVEDYLFKLARENAPKDLPDGDDNRKKRSEAWDRWWNANKATVAMVDRFSPSARERQLGYTLLVQANNNMIVEWDKERKIRWQLTGLLNPWDAQWLPGNRILVTEYNGQRVTERNQKGDILWQVNVPSWPMQAERLSNGRTFVVCRNMLLEYDRSGRQVFKVERPHDIMSARRLPNGQMVVVTSNRQILRLDRSGKEIKSATVPNIYYNQNEILNNGNVLVPLGWNNLLVEYNADGKEVDRVSISQPMHAIRLPNGHTLVSSQNWPYRIYELDKKGNQLGDYTTNNAYVFRVRRR